ncbi:ribosomal-processing cysteine protease Prp [Butyrivibrio sp. NC3005]|jgi:hypothetical protein|uniref:ribosomal-processing cysteine protease Prp n=1 Tax=Butyrivibrio sp. NC3005 TaxID=1280685 RepID=UPI0003F4AD44|nr:ribosomal-processing cysteine protease Prp [Butyrivibrio sp. NC3005]
MTNITIQKNAKGWYKGFSCNGHSGFSYEGMDIVCAAISMLTINTINSIEELCGDLMDVEADEEQGFISCKFKSGVSDISDEATLLMKSFELGVTSVFKQYGEQYLNIKFEEV